MNDFINWINGVGNAIFNFIITFLPDSPFLHIQDIMPDFVRSLLGYVNYYCPISEMLTIGAAWIGAIIIYYLYKFVLRKLNAIS